MPIKRQGAAAAPKIKRVEQDQASGDHVSKEDLQDRLVVVTIKQYDDAHVGQYGTTAKAVADVIDIEGEDTVVHPSMWFFSNLAKQLGRGLSEGETGVGRIVTGPTKTGTGQWWGFAFSEDEAEYEKAEKALADVQAPF
jgi:hypothetical protein